jgi:hypothetical protein
MSVSESGIKGGASAEKLTVWVYKDIVVESQEIDIRIKKWLSSKEGQAVLVRVARAMSAWAGSKGLSHAFLMKDPYGEYAFEDLVDDIRSELSLFIIENSARLSAVLLSENSNPYPFLKKAFINHWITNTRRGDRDPQRAFYKRMQDVLRNAEGIHLMSEPKRPLCFSLALQNSNPCLCQEDILAIPFPGTIERRHDAINKRDVLLELARYFWQEVSRMWGDIPVWVDIRDLVRWIEHYAPLEVPIICKESKDGRSLLDNSPHHNQAHGIPYWDRDLVTRWAGHFAKRMSKKERDVFTLTYDAGLNLREVAQELNYRGSSGPKYILECINDKLRFFLRDLPWVSPDDLCQEAFSLFMDTLILNLKKTPPTP